MNPTDPYQRTSHCHYSPINVLPDEVLLDIFDFYRQGNCYYDRQWKKIDVWWWTRLAHVCRKWRAAMFASPNRLNFAVTIGMVKPDDIETILSGSLPIRIQYWQFRANVWSFREPTGDPLRRLRHALKHHDRVREISLEVRGPWWDEFFKETNCPFPALESLVLRFGEHGRRTIPDTFLGGPDHHSVLNLRDLRLHCASPAYISRFLLSATALTDLSLKLVTTFGPSPETSLLACLQSTLCLRHLDLLLSYERFDPPSYPPTPEDIVSLSKLTSFRYGGHTGYLEALVASLSAPSLRDVDIDFLNKPPVVHLPRFINEIDGPYYAVHVVFRAWNFHVSLLTQSEYISQCKPRFQLGSMKFCPDIPGMCDAVCAGLTTVQELCVIFQRTAAEVWEGIIPWRRLLHRLPSVKVLRTEDANNYAVARSLLQDDEEPDDGVDFMPSLEEIELGKNLSSTDENQRESELAAFQPFVSSRQQADHPVRVFFRT